MQTQFFATDYSELSNFDYHGYFRQGACFIPIVELSVLFFVNRTIGVKQIMKQVMVLPNRTVERSCMISAAMVGAGEEESAADEPAATFSAASVPLSDLP